MSLSKPQNGKEQEPEKRYKCELCNKFFVTKGTLGRHERDSYEHANALLNAGRVSLASYKEGGAAAALPAQRTLKHFCVMRFQYCMRDGGCAHFCAAAANGHADAGGDTVPFAPDVTDEDLEKSDPLAARIGLKVKPWKIIQPGERKVEDVPALKLLSALGMLRL